MENLIRVKVQREYNDSTKLITNISVIAGFMPIGYLYRLKHATQINNSILLVTFILLFFVIVVWIDVLSSPHNTVIEITRAIDLFMEAFSSIMSLATVIKKDKCIRKVWENVIQADAALQSLGLDIPYTKIKRQSKITFICFFIIHVSLFVTNYFLLTHASNNTFVLPSFIVLAIYITHTSCGFTMGCFVLNMFRERFYLLNTALTNLQNDAECVSKESRNTALTTHQQLQKINSAHDKYVSVCEFINSLHHIVIFLRVLSYTGVITAKLYTVINMFMDQQCDSYILSHCIIWVTYRLYNLLLLVFVYTFTANEVSVDFKSTTVTSLDSGKVVSIYVM